MLVSFIKMQDIHDYFLLLFMNNNPDSVCKTVRVIYVLISRIFYGVRQNNRRGFAGPCHVTKSIIKGGRGTK